MRKRKTIHTQVDLPPLPPLFEKDKFIDNINNKLVEAKSGNYLIKLIDLKDGRRTWVSYEYHYDIICQITDLNDAKREYGVIVPGLGKDPIQLNTNRKIIPSNFFDFNNFEEQLMDRLLKWQICINEEGHYDKK